MKRGRNPKRSGFTRLLKRAWFKVLVGVGLAALVVSLAQPETFRRNHDAEPLADPKTLSLLMNGDQAPIPADVPYAEFHGLKVTPPKVASLLNAPARVLGDNTADKRIEVDLTHQHLYAFENNVKVYDFLVSTGKWYPTPTGTFHIWTKIKSTTMSGGNPADGTYYYLTNIPWVMFFAGGDVAASRGFSLHGIYWHNNFGHPMSHGCVNMRIADAKTIFDWVRPVTTDLKAWSTNATSDNPGTEIVIYGQTPKD